MLRLLVNHALLLCLDFWSWLAEGLRCFYMRAVMDASFVVKPRPQLINATLKHNNKHACLLGAEKLSVQYRLSNRGCKGEVTASQHSNSGVSNLCQKSTPLIQLGLFSRGYNNSRQ